MALPTGMYSIKQALNPANYNAFIDYYKNLNYSYIGSTGYEAPWTPATSGSVNARYVDGTLQRVEKPTGYDPSATKLYSYQERVPYRANSGRGNPAGYKVASNPLDATLPEQVFKDFESHMNYLKIRKPQSAAQDVVEEADQQTKKKEKAKTTSQTTTAGARALAIPVGGGGSSVGR